MSDVVLPPKMLFVPRLQVGKLGSLGVYEIDQEDVLLMTGVLTTKTLTYSCPDQVMSLSSLTSHIACLRSITCSLSVETSFYKITILFFTMGNPSIKREDS